MIISPNMSLIEWNDPSDVFSHPNLANNFYLLDLHDHSSGKGVQIGTAGIQANAITAPLIAAGAVGSTQLATNAVGNSQIQANAVHTAQIQDGAIISSKFSSATWVGYNPVWTAVTVNPVIGNGSLVGRYYLVGKSCFVEISLTIGSSTTQGTGLWRLSLPVAAVSGRAQSLSGYNNTAVGGLLPMAVQTVTSTARVNLAVGVGVPNAWDTVDTLVITGVYETV